MRETARLSQNDLRAHFGLGTATTVDRVEVRWPSGGMDTFAKLDVNRIVTRRP